MLFHLKKNLNIIFIITILTLSSNSFARDEPPEDLAQIYEVAFTEDMRGDVASTATYYNLTYWKEGFDECIAYVFHPYSNSGDTAIEIESNNDSIRLGCNYR